MTVLQTRTPSGVILYDGDAVAEIRDEHFDPAWWRRQNQVIGAAHGRGAVVFVRHDGESWALRHFYRGGWMAKLSPDRYVWLGRERTRMWREWRMLAELRRRGLPVPEPIAARFTRSGPFYRGDLITRLIEGADTLAHTLRDRALPPEEWRAIGALLARLQASG
ncbi:MAG: 3-deoxy-D-manno-octulosonic acid kinase, partial [Opitutaceae bacterium]